MTFLTFHSLYRGEFAASRTAFAAAVALDGGGGSKKVRANLKILAALEAKALDGKLAKKKKKKTTK
jgi:hypothetical protein